MGKIKNFVRGIKYSSLLFILITSFLVRALAMIIGTIGLALHAKMEKHDF
jgi:hypothetical protein